MGGGASTPAQIQTAQIRKQEGDQFYHAQNYNAACMKYTEAINLDKTKAVYYSNRAACYTELKNYSKAAADGKKCFELDGRFAKGYYRYAKAKKMLGDTKEAIKYARHGISIDPACEDLRHLLVQELGVLESELPENPNKNAQIQPIVAEGSVPVVQGMAVPEQQMQPQPDVQQQQPMMMQGQQQQQPMMMQGQQQQQPMMIQGQQQQQPMMIQGQQQQQPMMMQGQQQQQPMMMQGQQPMMMQGQQPMMMQGQQPMMMQGQQPMMMQGQQPMMMQGQQPMMMQGQPAPGQRGSMPGQGNNNEVATAAMAGLIGGALMGGMFG